MEQIFLFFGLSKIRLCMTHATTNACVIKKNDSNKGSSRRAIATKGESYRSLGLGYWTPKLGE